MPFYKLLPIVLFLLAGIPGRSQSSDEVPGVVAILDHGHVTDNDAAEEQEGHSAYLTVAGFVTITPAPMGAQPLHYRGYYILDSAQTREKQPLEQGVTRQV